MTDHERTMRELLMPIAVLKHHQMVDPALSTYDICDRLGHLWPEIQRATLDIIGRAYGRIVSSKEIIDLMGSES